jgi:hypothetical protein
MKIQKNRRSIVSFLSSFIIFGAAQSADTGARAGNPIYLSINSHAGHGIGSALSIRVNQQADIYAFLFDQLGMQLPRK